MVAGHSTLGVIKPSLRATELKRLCFLCGLQMSGRKAELIARLTAAANSAPPPPKPRSGPVVLSIDLGIRNLAFSLLTPVRQAASAPRKKAGADAKKQRGTDKSLSFFGTAPPAIELHAWRRLSLIDGPTRTTAEDGDEDALDADTPATLFAPAALAKTANAFLQETVLQFKPLPTHILIEQQRWRSGGAAAILEWTVRVNTLEAMLHASLRTLRDVGVWKGEVMSIRPERVGQLFLDPENTDTGNTAQNKALEEDGEDAPTSRSKRKPSTGRTTSAETKKLKIEFLARCLGHRDLIVPAGNVEAGQMLDAYRHASKGAGRGKSKRGTREENAEGKLPTLDKKLDDLTDSLLQGMAWLRWQENMALLKRENGVEQLLGWEPGLDK